MHGIRRSLCKECSGGESACTAVGALCKECGGGSICVHGRVRSLCKECGGGSICVHGRRRSRCKECKKSLDSTATVTTPPTQTRARREGTT